MSFKSPSIVLEMLCAILLKNEPIEVAVGEGPEEVVAVGIRLWPRVEVLSWSRGVSIARDEWI